ncbi:DUF1707 and DUF4190 domain-containing protein [Streptomyces lasiicapitis]|uniref:DUF1707 and DUF4190 domain-containing protein n=1 Tax=Streptomyces lasiicapitis TaxID=1923961 RepID=A0ABQ2MK23_9ACTN|nr:hypothetical protein GCM10012286_60410 [Streptomyces lasiicapitis]
MTNPSWQPGPWPPKQPGLPAHMPAQAGQPSMLAGHSDRERTVDVLRAGFAEGRLPQDEYERRVDRALQARTVGELGLLVADLPQGPIGFQQPAPQHVPATFMPVAPPTNGKAGAALACGIGTFFTLGLTGVPAVVLGHMARTEIRRTHEGGDGMAVAGLVLGWLSIAGWALFLMLIMIAASA